MSIWRQGASQQNPYYRTAFRVCRIPRETTRHRTLVQVIGQTRRIVKTSPDHHVISGEPVTDAELNSAEKKLLDSRQRIAEELLHHSTEKPPYTRLKKLAADVAATLKVEDAEPVEIEDFSWLETWAKNICERFLDEQHQTGITAGPLELDLIPPFGPDEDEREY